MIKIMRNSLRGAARYLITVAMGAIVAASVLVCLLVMAMQQRGIGYRTGKPPGLGDEEYFLISGLIWIVFIFIYGVVSRDRLKLCIAAVVIIVLLTSGYVAVSAYLQQGYVKNAQEFRKKKDLPYTPAELFPKASTQSQCKEWNESVQIKEKIEEKFWDAFYNTWQSTMRKGIITSEAIDENDLTENPEWNKFTALNKAGIEAMKKCPYFQWFNAQEYDVSKYRGKTTPSRSLDFIHWTRAIETQALILAKNGQVPEAKALLYDLHEATDKLHIPGQNFIMSLTAIAMNERIASGFIGILALTSSPFPEEDIEKISTFTKIDPAWAKSYFDEDYYREMKQSEECLEDVIMYYAPGFQQRPKLISANWIAHKSKIVLCAMLRSYTKNMLPPLNIASEWMRKVPDFEKGHFAWHEARYALVYQPNDYHNFTKHAYARLIRNSVLWRLVLAMNQIMHYYQANGMLPDSIEASGKDWPLDPFDDNPLRYRKTSDNSLIIYSVGLDEKDDNGENLRISGPVGIDEPLDIGFHIVL
ncbi:MAG: hypothetical protein A2Y62_14760 [Candidatus Fischerbacteria bacterium RBG_13_37_8]|uniref:Uncharacterized protein n=1 Tax=Candidatus Fischerbacteria bacterium RBG_13_37_8 TaxID=1817863 RepID=A0A1F5VNV0_9BACT|nr:MAG: hypothetical protein A2Y62_14760 [Candidatus Fischerbacteria bacterium RBG_13_37_8]